MRTIVSILLLTISFSCSSRDLDYKNSPIVKKYSSKHTIHVDNEKYESATIYLNENNIEDIQQSSKNEDLIIVQKEKNKLSNLKSICDSLSKDKKYNIETVFINKDIIQDVGLMRSTYLDPKLISSLEIIKKKPTDSLPNHKNGAITGDLLVIKTK